MAAAEKLVDAFHACEPAADHRDTGSFSHPPGFYGAGRVRARRAPGRRLPLESCEAVTDAPGRFAPNAEVYGPDYYERMYRPHWFLRNRRKYEERDAALLRIVRPAPSVRILEVGSARGDTAFFFAPRVKEVLGIDAAPAAVAAARTRLAALALPNVRFEEADARDLSSVPGGPFDVVLLADFVEHAADSVLIPCLSSARRALRPGGALAIYTPNATHWAERIKAAVPFLQQEDHIAVRKAERVVALTEAAGFRVEDLFFSASPYPVLGAFDRALPMVGLCRFRTCLRAVTSPP